MDEMRGEVVESLLVETEEKTEESHLVGGVVEGGLRGRVVERASGSVVRVRRSGGGRAYKPGPASLAGLAWLVRVGPVTEGAWRTAMGWSVPTVESHTKRLVAAGWLERCSRTLGQGPLLYASLAGVQKMRPEMGIGVKAVKREPAPTWWAHHEACGWVAAWLSARGRELVGARELLADDGWRGELEWREHGGVRRRSHRPDLIGVMGGARLPIEVELQDKSPARLRAVLELHAGWVAARKSAAVVYVCGNPGVAERVREQAAQVGLSREQKTLRIELLNEVKAAAVAARASAATHA